MGIWCSVEGEITLDDFDIVFNNKGDSLNCEDGNLGGVVLEGYEVEEETIGVREVKSCAYEVIKRMHLKESKK